MKRALLVLLVAGCGGSEPSTFGINVRVDASSLSQVDRSVITTASLTVTGVEPYERTFDIAKPIKSGEVRFRYIPKAQSGTLTLAFDALAADETVVASGISDPVDLTPGKAVEALITLGAPSVQDMGMSLDGGDEDGGADVDMAHPTKPQGATCSSSAECVTAGGCVDGHCCDTTCTGACEACDIAGKEGTCSPVAAGSMPEAGHATCGPDDKSTCKRDGTCDGAGACKLWALGTVCQTGTCNPATNMVTSDSTCDGNGTCTASSTITCAPYVCKDASVCWPSCTDNGECSSGNFCNGNSCGKKPLGSTCSTSADCQNGTDGNAHCVDGVCCDTACTGTCQFCALASAKGTCSLAPAGTDPRSVCPTGTGSNAICTPGGCTGTSMACRKATQGTACAGSCSGGSASNTTCDASGGCTQSAGSTNCGAYSCVVGAGGTQATCNTMCSGDGDCNQPSYACNTRTHECGLVNGKSCTSGSQCASGACAPEGICCNSACDGQCQYCDTSGICQYATGAPHAPRAACTNEGTAPCGGSCSGTSASCTYPTVKCLNASCVHGCGQLNCYCPLGLISTSAGYCSNGSCVYRTSCCSPGYACHTPFGSSEYDGTCWMSCSSNNQCDTGDGYVCQSSMCQIP